MKLLVISDIHANWRALNAVVAAEANIDAILCLGDIVNYGPHPVACVEWVRARVADRGWVVQGNHDRAVGLGEDPWCSPAFRDLAASMQAFSEPLLSSEQRRWLGPLPAWADFWLPGQRILACHAIPTAPYFDYVGACEVARWKREVAYAGDPDFLLGGHTHVPFSFTLGRTTILNPGSVGLGIRRKIARDTVGLDRLLRKPALFRPLANIGPGGVNKYGDSCSSGHIASLAV